MKFGFKYEIWLQNLWKRSLKMLNLSDVEQRSTNDLDLG